ncbi:unnamed protein product [Blumeria hordei]|uniref:Uncharacterized protein n=1 Tax=Blumeria hordei TaxID=2867405 RepID=A0A383UNP6_BLUHO|nr:unnamed protein product [Blumeria hordei]
MNLLTREVMKSFNIGSPSKAKPAKFFLAAVSSQSWCR